MAAPAAHSAAEAGKRSALVTDGPIGGDCTWTGCVPSKTLISATAQGLDFGAAMRRVRETISAIAATESADVLEAEGVTVIEGRGRLLGDGAIDVEGSTVRTSCWQQEDVQESRPFPDSPMCPISRTKTSGSSKTLRLGSGWLVGERLGVNSPRLWPIWALR